MNPLPSVKSPNRWNLTLIEAEKAFQWQNDGLALDSVLIFIDRLDFRKDHIAGSDVRGFEPGTGKEVLPYILIQVETVKALRSYLNTILGGNVFQYTPVLVNHPWIDFLYREAWCPQYPYDDDSLNQLMVLMRNKPRSYLDYNLLSRIPEDKKRLCLEKLILHGIFPGIDTHVGDRNEMKELISILSDYKKILDSLSTKRWEPISEIDIPRGEGVSFERFSDPISDLYIIYSDRGSVNFRGDFEGRVVEPLLGSISNNGTSLLIRSAGRLAAFEIYDNSSYSKVNASIREEGSNVCLRVEAPRSHLLKFRYSIGQNTTNWTDRRRFCFERPINGTTARVDVKIGRLGPISFKFKVRPEASVRVSETAAKTPHELKGFERGNTSTSSRGNIVNESAKVTNWGLTWALIVPLLGVLVIGLLMYKKRS